MNDDAGGEGFSFSVLAGGVDVFGAVGVGSGGGEGRGEGDIFG